MNYSKSVLCFQLVFSIVFFVSCDSNKQLISEPFYAYDFESDYRNIDSVYISNFDGSKVMGPFNNSGFSLGFEDLPKHDFIRLRFDLYIHDSWEGNTNNTIRDTPDHDAWFIEFDPHLKVKASEKLFFETTFSNSYCVPSYCHTQSFPNEFPFSNEARTGASNRTTFGRCIYKDSPRATTIYKIEKIYPHTNGEFVVAFYDRLKQDGPFPPLCEESWSMDNLDITLLTEK